MALHVAPPGRRLAVVLAVAMTVGGCRTPTPATEPAQEGDPGQAVADADQHRWHAPRKAARNAPRRTPEPAPHLDALSKLAQQVKHDLEAHGITQDLDVGVIYQHANPNGAPTEDESTATWQSVGDWALTEPADGEGTFYLSWIAFGAKGLGHDTDDGNLSGLIGSISDLNSTDWPNAAIVDELALKYVSADGTRTVSAGKVDLSYHFDTNRAANDGYTQFMAFSLVNNISIPFPGFGSTGVWGRLDDGDRYLLLGVADSAMFKAVAPWEEMDGSWYELAELGFHYEAESLGKGTLRVNPWHNHLYGEDGWGLGVNLDQELGSEKHLGFFRAGAGDGDVTPVRRFLSGGVGLTGLFDRPDDTLGIGASWSDPAQDNGTRAETLIETYYAFQLTPTVSLTPDVQVVFHPSGDRDSDRVVVAGLRLMVQF